MRYFGVGVEWLTGPRRSLYWTTMSEPDKKDKPKKKKSTTKEKEEGKLSAPEGERKESLTPERKSSQKESKSRKSSSVDGLETEVKSRRESTAETEAKSRKPSTANLLEEEPRSRKSSNVELKDEAGSRKASEVTQPELGESEEANTQQEEAPSSSAEDQVKPVKYFEAPPESTKTDIHLLKDLDTRRLAELMEAFVMFDFDQDGVINENDLKRTFASLDRPDMPEEEIRQMLSEGLNPLDFDAFVVLMGYKSLELDAEEVLTDALAQWDYGTEGLISESRIRHDLVAFGDRFTDEEANAALEDAPVLLTKNKERMIEYARFSNDLCGLRKRMKDYKPMK